MRTIPKALMVLVFGVAPLLGAAPARAGGGCQEGMTRGTGTAIKIVDACFTPTILHAQPGQTVTWVNADPFVHNITANGWGHFDDLKPSERFTATFDEPGLYPFACTYHPGMSGVIVVGSGSGLGNGTNVEVAAPVAPAAPAAVLSSDAPGDAGGRVAAAAVGLLLGALVGLGLAEVRRRATGT